MSDQTQTPETEIDDLPMPDELTLLKQQAKLMGISHSPNIGVDALRKKIQDHKEASASAEAKPEAAPASVPAAAAAAGKVTRKQIIDENMKLIRLRITNLNPKKRNLQGEIFTIGNETLGVVRKFVPFGEVTDNGYHVPYCIYQMMKAKRFYNIRRFKNAKGEEVVKTEWVPEFALEVLPPLTPEELRKLAIEQKAAGNY